MLRNAQEHFECSWSDGRERGRTEGEGTEGGFGQNRLACMKSSNQQNCMQCVWEYVSVHMHKGKRRTLSTLIYNFPPLFL